MKILVWKEFLSSLKREKIYIEAFEQYRQARGEYLHAVDHYDKEIVLKRVIYDAAHKRFEQVKLEIPERYPGEYEDWKRASGYWTLNFKNFRSIDMNFTFESSPTTSSVSKRPKRRPYISVPKKTEVLFIPKKEQRKYECGGSSSHFQRSK